MYTYSHNNPIVYGDPDGQLTIIIGGTGAGNPSWGQRGISFSNAVSKTFGEQAIVVPWSGSLSSAGRSAGATNLYHAIQSHQFKPGEKLNIVAHSHGGNVVKEYSQMPGARKIDTAVNLGTPQRSDYTMKEGMVDTYVNVYSKGDLVQPVGGYTPQLNPMLRIVNPKVEGGPAGQIDPSALNIEIEPIALPGRRELFNPLAGGYEVENYYYFKELGHSDLHTTKAWDQVEKAIPQQ